MAHVLKVGTRGSPLAVAQTKIFIEALQARHPGLTAEVVTIVTSGDRIQDRALSQAGGKGLFTKEIEEALLQGKIDCAVHSLKDMPTRLPEGLELSCILPREDPRDAFFSPKAETLDDLPPGAVVGTASLRRQAIVLARRPDLKVALLRGNVGTRLKKLQAGEVDATLLAVAGLKRLGQGHLIKTILEPDVMLPAPAQGAVCIETCAADLRLRDLLSPVHCRATEMRVSAERAFLDVMDGSCRTPLGALMGVPDAAGLARLDLLVARPDGSDIRTSAATARILTVDDARELGRSAGLALKAQLPKGYFSQE